MTETVKWAKSDRKKEKERKRKKSTRKDCDRSKRARNNRGITVVPRQTEPSTVELKILDSKLSDVNGVLREALQRIAVLEHEQRTNALIVPSTEKRKCTTELHRPKNAKRSHVHESTSAMGMQVARSSRVLPNKIDAKLAFAATFRRSCHATEPSGLRGVAIRPRDAAVIVDLLIAHGRTPDGYPNARYMWSRDLDFILRLEAPYWLNTLGCDSIAEMMLKANVVANVWLQERDGLEDIIWLASLYRPFRTHQESLRFWHYFPAWKPEDKPKAPASGRAKTAPQACSQPEAIESRSDEIAEIEHLEDEESQLSEPSPLYEQSLSAGQDEAEPALSENSFSSEDELSSTDSEHAKEAEKLAHADDSEGDEMPTPSTAPKTLDLLSKMAKELKSK